MNAYNTIEKLATLKFESAKTLQKQQLVDIYLAVSVQVEEQTGREPSDPHLSIRDSKDSLVNAVCDLADECRSFVAARKLEAEVARTETLNNQRHSREALLDALASGLREVIKSAEAAKNEAAAAITKDPIYAISWKADALFMNAKVAAEATGMLAFVTRQTQLLLAARAGEPIELEHGEVGEETLGELTGRFFRIAEHHQDRVLGWSPCRSTNPWSNAQDQAEFEAAKRMVKITRTIAREWTKAIEDNEPHRLTYIRFGI